MNSEINPLKGGNPHIANAAIKNRKVVCGIFLTNPPSFSMSSVCVA